MSSVATEVGRPTAAATEISGDLGLFHRALAEYCRSGVPLPRALSMLHDDLETRGLRRECESMAREVEQGEPWPEVYGRRQALFPPVYHALMEAGVASGDLPAVLEEIAAHASLRARVASGLRRRLGYPLLAGVVVLLIGVALVVGVAPITRGLSGAAGLRGVAPSALFATCVVASLLALVVVLAFGVAFARRPLDPGAGPHGLLFRLPLIGRLRCYAGKASFAATMALLLRRRLPLARALQLAATTCDDAALRAHVERMAARAAAGADLGEALHAGDLLPPSLLWFVSSATSSDAAARALEDIAAVYRERLERAADRVAVFTVPLLELAVGVVVLVFALGYVMPAFDLLQGFLGLFRVSGS